MADELARTDARSVVELHWHLPGPDPNLGKALQETTGRREPELPAELIAAHRACAGVAWARNPQV